MKALFCLRLEHQILDLTSRVLKIAGKPHVNRHRNLAFLGGTVIVAIMVVTAFANVANANGCPRGKSVEATSVDSRNKAAETAEVEA